MAKTKRVLVVDDDERILSSFRRVLEQEGYSVDVAATGMEALEKIKKRKFNICLVDVRLPDMDGADLVKKITNPGTVKIIITGYSSEEVGARAADSGADDYLAKPVRPKDLLEVIKERVTAKEDLLKQSAT